MSAIHIQVTQDLVDELSHTPECHRLFEQVLGRSVSECLLTDDSALSDFVGTGVDAPGLQPNQSYEAYCDAWDQWVLAKIRAEFGLHLSTSDITLIQLIHQLRTRQTSSTALH